MTPGPSLPELIAVVREDSPSDDALVRLAQASRTVAELEQVADSLIGHFVDECRRSGRSWSEISGALGVSKQAAHKRFADGAPAFDRFTDRARSVLRAAADQSRALGHGFVGTEHLLLGLFEPTRGVAAQVLADAGITQEACEAQVLVYVPNRSQPGVHGELPFTPRAVNVLRVAVEEALGFGHNYIGTEHLLLALFRDPDGVAAKVLHDVGFTYDDAKSRITAKIAELIKPGPPPPPG